MHLPVFSHRLSYGFRVISHDDESEVWRTMVILWSAAVLVGLVAVLGIGSALVHSETYHRFLESRVHAPPGEMGEQASQLAAQVRTYLRSDGIGLIDELSFTNRERLHFAEVRSLIREAGQVLYVAAHAAVLLVVGVLVRSLFYGRFALAIVGDFLMRSSFILILGVAAASVALFVDFDQSYYELHQMLFVSTNWLLPADSLTLRLFPSQYFIQFAIGWGAGVLTFACILAAIGRLLRLTAHERGPAAR